ncbi:nuclear transport factor 2 family protein [Kitasatospora sp. NPDC056446]|uniref:nuclear transport factor 2 family protein n=1 Tax=Kitasatospora sp. NPDC056446 TaxID=3345819 RepID=UPI0036AC0CA0
MNLAQAQEFYDAVDTGDIAGLIGRFAPEGSYHRPGYDPLVGRERVRRFYAEERKIKEGRHVLERVVASDGLAAVHGTFSGTLHDGSPADLRFADFFELTPEGLITRRDTFFFTPLV